MIIPLKIVAKFLRFWTPVFMWAGVIYFFSAHPTGTASEIHWQDFIVKKLAHVFEYGVLAALTFRALTNTGVSRKKAGYIAMIASVFYAITDETHQAFTPGREPRARDLIFDTIGAGLAIYSIWNIIPKAPTRLKNWARDFQLT